jgi:hypothetical protein
VSVPSFDYPMGEGVSPAGHSPTRAVDQATACDLVALVDLDGYLDCSRTAGHSADVEREVEHDMEGLALEDHGGNSHRWKTWSARPEAESIVAVLQEGVIV